MAKPALLCRDLQRGVPFAVGLLSTECQRRSSNVVTPTVIHLHTWVRRVSQVDLHTSFQYIEDKRILVELG